MCLCDVKLCSVFDCKSNYNKKVKSSYVSVFYFLTRRTKEIEWLRKIHNKIKRYDV